MDTVGLQSRRIVSAMRPTGQLHLGHYHGVLKHWIKLQHEHDCFFFVADWHALTTHYDDSQVIEESVWEMVIDWIATGIEPSAATLFLQSKIPEHAELHLLLSMITPVSWLERVPSYKEQQEKLKQKDLSTYGFLGYPLLQSADVLIYNAGQVPVGEDQVAHVELTRDIARRFNHIYGREKGFEEKAVEAVTKMGKKNAKMYTDLRHAYQQQGDAEALATARALLESQQNLALGDTERLFAYLEGDGKIIIPEPQVLLTPMAKIPGLDGQKMSKSYGNTISLRDSDKTIAEKINKMSTVPLSLHPAESNEPSMCPVCQLYALYARHDQEQEAEVACGTTGNRCWERKDALIELIRAELKPIRERAEELSEYPEDVRRIVDEGNEAAREVARDTLDEVRSAMGLGYK